MFALKDYIIDEEIHENNRIRVFRGRTVQGGKPVIIKALKEEAANPSGISRLLYEYEITRNLDIDGIIKPVKLEQQGMIFALIMEDIGAVSLREYIQNNPVSLSIFFDIAVQLVETLGHIHQKGVIHRDLKPDNIIIHSGTGKVKIIDFGAAAHFVQAGSNTPTIDFPVGTLQYMPPEQTGRMEQIADYRSDFYSLGVVFYELLAGRLPWQAENSMAWIHAHLACKPELPDEINQKIEPTIAAIIMKLLSKTADERYQGAYGLLQDLEKCRRRWNRKGRIEPFPIGQMDVSAYFRLPHKLYGREKEMEALKAAFERVCTGQTEIVLVGGYAGIGKTMLINKTLRPIVSEKGYFISGKFDLLRQNVPYAPIAQAFGGLIQQLMTESTENLAIWKRRLQRALGHSGAVIIEVIPEVELIVGRQPDVEALQPKEAQNRFLMVFRDFIRIFAGKEHPLVIFLDDLQWADMASLELIQHLSDDSDSPYLLLIGAYRDNEVVGVPRLEAALESFRKAEIKAQYITLSPLERLQAEQLIADALYCESEKSDTLAEILFRQSCGNPFFLGQLLKSIYDEKLLAFNAKNGCWDWELESIQKLQMTEDVVKLILGKLQKLPEDTRHVLELAACIGSIFDMRTLSSACEKTPAETAACLLPLIREGLVMLIFHPGIEAVDDTILNNTYEFLHDRVQQAAYSLIPEEEKKEVHLKVGRMILQNTGQDELGEKILPVMDHFNRGLDLVKAPEERLKLAGYNLLAGQKAKTSTAYDSALNYFKAGMLLLPDNSWNHCYQLSYDLHLERAQCEYLMGYTETAEKLFDMIIDRSETELERAGIYGLKMVLYAGMGRYNEAAQIGINALREFDIKLPVCPGKIYYAKEVLLYKWYMRDKRVEDLVDLPEMKDPVQRKAAELLIRLACVISTSNSDLYGLTIIKAGNHAVKYGNTEMASIGYIGYSIVTGSVFGDYAAGYEYGKVCIRLAEKYDKSFSKCIVYFTVGAIVSHWTQHCRVGLDYMNKAIRCGIEAGDVLIIGYARSVILDNKYYMGVSLQEILEEAKKSHSYAKRMKHEYLGRGTIILQRRLSSLRGQESDYFAPGTESLDEDGFIELLKGDKAALASYYYSKIQLCYLFGDYRNALYFVEKIKDYMDALLGFMFSTECNFYHSLVITALYEELPSKDKKKYWKMLKKNQRQMKKWSESCKENFLHKYLLVEAEIARLGKRGQEAASLYDQAIQSARENGYVQNEALANELAARSYMAEGRDKIAGMYMQDACNGYKQWGAAAKVQDMQRKYPYLRDENMDVERTDTVEVLKSVFQYSAASNSNPTSEFDSFSIQKAVQRLSEIKEPNKLLKSFLNIAVESAGADKGYLILEKNGELFIEAAKESDKHPVTADKPALMEKSTNLSKAVVRYTARTLETVVLNNGKQTEIFARDTYLAKAGARSIACLPVSLQGIPVGVLYLENSLMTGVFTPDRMEGLKLLCTQMAYIKTLQAYLEEAAVTNGIVRMPLLEPLTDREIEVLKLIAAGMSNKEISGRLEMTINTVKTHIKNIYGKLHVNRRVQVAARANELKII